MLGLDNIFKKKEKDKQEYYLGLVLQEKSGIALLLHVDNLSSKVTLAQQIPFQFTNHWDTIVEDIDEVLYRLEELTKIKVDKVLYFLYSHLVDFQTKHIKAPYLEKLKIVSSELGLEPLGYIEHHEALSEFLTSPESGPLNGIIVESDLTAVSCFIYKNGEPLFIESSAKTQDPVLDVQVMLEKALHTYSLPSRLIVYSGVNYDELPTKIESHTWPENFFVEKPTVTHINQNQLQQALLLGVQKQLFSAPAPMQPQQESPVVIPADMYPPDEMPEEAVSQQQPEQPEQPEQHEQSEPEVAQEAMMSEPQQRSDDAFGFAIGQDLSSSQSEIEQNEPLEELEEESSPFMPLETPKPKFKFPALSFLAPLSRIHLPYKMPSAKAQHIIIPLLGILLIGGSIFSVLFYFHKASVVIVQNSTSLEKEVQIGKELTVAKKTTQVSASETVDTSGTKYVGESAKGSITLYNAEPKSVTIEKGTILKNGDAQYVLDEDVKIASASGQVTSDGNVLTVTGKATGNLSAKDIGPEFNVKKDTKFSIANRSSSAQFAVAANNFSGGTKKEVQIASRQDLTTLKNKVQDAIQKKAADAISSGGNAHLISKLTEIETTKEKFSSEVSEEADKVSLTTEANVTVYSYQINDMKDLLSEALKGSVDPHLSLANDHITFSITDAKKNKDDTFSLDVKAKAKLAPKIDEQKLLHTIQGKKASSLKDYFDQSMDVSSYQAEVSSPIPFLKSYLPFFSRNISLQLKLE